MIPTKIDPVLSRIFSKAHLWAVVLLCGLGLLTFSNGLKGEFMMDDHGFFADPKMQNVRFLPYFFLPDKSRVLAVDAQPADTYYRPIAHIVPMISYLNFKDNVFAYHLANLLLFVLAAFCIYLLIGRITRDSLLGFLTAAFFLVHPINGLTVNYITASVFSCQVILMALSLWTLMRTSATPTGRVLRQLISLGLFAGALMCHETAMLLPFYGILILGYTEGRKAIVRTGPHLIFLFGYLLLRTHYASIQESIFAKIAHFEMGPLEFAATYAKVSLWYLTRLIVPDGIVLKWAAPVVRSLGTIWIGGMASVIALAYLLHRNRQRYPAAAIGAVWLLLGFLPVGFACLFEPKAGFIIEPHWLIFASIGFFLLIGSVLRNIRPTPRHIAILILLVSWIGVSRVHNWIWADEIRYCRHWLKEMPGYKSAVFYLADAHLRAGQPQKAEHYYRQAIEDRWQDWQIHNNLGLIALQKNDLENAHTHFLNALKWNSASAQVHNNIGLVYLRQGEWEHARQAFTQAVQSNRFLIEPYLNLALIAQEQGEESAAIGLYKKALDLVPHHADSLTALIELSLRRGDAAQALVYAQELLRTSSEPRATVAAGSLLAMHGMTQPALDLYERTLQLDPDLTAAYKEMGKLLANTGAAAQASRIWEEGARKDPQDPEFPQLQEALKGFTEGK